MSEWPLRHDSTRDGRVDLADVAELAEAWLRQLEWIEPGVTIRIVQPGTGGLVSLGQGGVDIRAEFIAGGVTIVRVQFYLDGTLIYIDYDGTNGWVCNDASFKTVGVHRIDGQAIDSIGGMYEAESVEIRAVE